MGSWGLRGVASSASMSISFLSSAVISSAGPWQGVWWWAGLELRFVQQVMPRQRIILMKSLEEAGILCGRSAAANLRFNSLFQFQIYRIYSFFRSREFCADMRLRFFFLVSCDSSSKTKGDSSDSSILIQSRSACGISCLDLICPSVFLSLACVLLSLSLSLLAAESTSFRFSCGILQYCSRQLMISLRLVVLKHTQAAASRTICSPNSILLVFFWGSRGRERSWMTSSMKASSSFLLRPRKELMRQQSPLSSNLRSRQLG